MELFGVSPIELLFIAILGLIIFGPERLPEIGRFLGRSVARVLAWQYTSPEAQMLNELRRDFEQQIVEIRDEMVYARQQLDVRAELSELQRETESLLRVNPLNPQPAYTNSPAVSETVTSTSTVEPPAVEPPPPVRVPAPLENGTDTADASISTTASDNGTDVTELAASTPTSENGTTAEVPLVSTPTRSIDGTLPTRQEIDTLSEQIQALSATLQTLQEQLRQRGLLDPAWQPPEEVPQEQIV